jgi:hypothetical protein
MKRNSVAEFQRRRSMILESWWLCLLAPMIFLANLYLADEEE